MMVEKARLPLAMIAVSCTKYGVIRMCFRPPAMGPEHLHCHLDGTANEFLAQKPPLRVVLDYPFQEQAKVELAWQLLGQLAVEYSFEGSTLGRDRIRSACSEFRMKAVNLVGLIFSLTPATNETCFLISYQAVPQRFQ
jgi:hypothetical protein